MPTHKVETIPFEALIKLEIPGGIYARLQQLLISYSQLKPQEEMLDALKRLGSKEEPANEFEYHLFTITMLVTEIEKQAKLQNLTKEEELEIPDKPSA